VSPLWLWPKTTMRPARREEMPGSPVSGPARPLLWVWWSPRC